jgi:hypothetical protein
MWSTEAHHRGTEAGIRRRRAEHARADDQHRHHRISDEPRAEDQAAQSSKAVALKP